MVMTTATASWEFLCIQAFPFAVPNGWSAETWMIFLTGWNSIKGLQTKPDQRRQAVVFGWRLPLLPLARETGTSWFEHRSNIRTAHHVYLQLPYIFCVQWRKNILISCSAFMNPLTILCPRILPPPFHVFFFWFLPPVHTLLFRQQQGQVPTLVHVPLTKHHVQTAASVLQFYRHCA